MNLRLIGAPKLSDIGPEMVDAKSVGLHVTMPGESSYMQNCEYIDTSFSNTERADRVCALLSRRTSDGSYPESEFVIPSPLTRP